jgi:hypothetical protein
MMIVGRLGSQGQPSVHGVANCRIIGICIVEVQRIHILARMAGRLSPGAGSAVGAPSSDLGSWCCARMDQGSEAWKDPSWHVNLRHNSSASTYQVACLVDGGKAAVHNNRLSDPCTSNRDGLVVQVTFFGGRCFAFIMRYSHDTPTQGTLVSILWKGGRVLLFVIIS